jgi:3' terminal RNA ribose 2'-O-methyltransferase Hen1
VLLTLTTTAEPATDLGHLLHKHPDRAQAFGVAAGTAHVFYPAAGSAECTAALLLDVDPVALARADGRGAYVDERPYVAGSHLAVALRTVFSSALHGRCAARPELAGTALPLTVHLPTLSCRPHGQLGPAELVERLFAPLGWTVVARALPLDPQFPEWGDARVVDVRLTGTLRVADALTQLYVLLPVLDGAKHYPVGAEEVDKLLRMGERWLAAHPERELISRRYLAHRRGLVASALEALALADGAPVEELDPDTDPDAGAEPRTPSLADQRRATVVAVLRELGAHRVVDLGCGPGALLRDLLADPAFTEILGVDVSSRALTVAARRLHLDRAGDRVRDRIALRQSALTYTDASLAGFDAAVLMEVVEHVDPERLPALAHAVFGSARPGAVLVTTPNAEHNVRYEGLPAGAFRHADHRFEWTRAEFRAWAQGVAERYGYTVAFRPVGPDDPEVGPPTQLGVFRRG